jgi:Uma2 family endonuclease
MAVVAEHKKTVADFMALGEGPPYAQLIDGEIIMAPSPFRNRQQLVLNLILVIGNHLESGADPGKLFVAPFDVHLSEHNVLCPDLCFFSGERLELLSERGAEGAPDLVIEVLSPSTARRDRKVKREIYARYGAKELWLVSPDTETIEVFDFFTKRDEPVVVLENGTHPAITTKLLPGLEIPLGRIFRR